MRYDLMEGSFDFESALEGSNSSSDAQFRIPRARHYVILSLDTESMEASEDDDGAWIDLKKDEAEAAFSSSTQRLAHALFRNSGGAIGQRASINSNTVQLANVDDAVFFKKGMRLQAATTDGTSGSLRAGTFATVSAVNRQLGQITAPDWANITGFADNDFLFPKGNFGKGVFGFEAYIPKTAPTPGGGDSFTLSGLDRSADPSRLAGMRFDGSSMAIEEALIKGLAQFRREGGTGTIDTIWTNYDRFVEIGLALGSKAMRDEASTAEFGYDVIRVHAGGKPVTLMADHNCQPDTAWCLSKKTIVFRSLGPVPRFLQRSGGSELIVEPASDGYQMRLGWRGNNVMTMPGKNGRITLPTGG
ncbi:MAG TPA: hypothetical protein VFU97_24500 [Xanthobacteraceae bacterium]|nr:hypothetical protein [Xanthobacteraceae bacterium]